MNDPFPRALVTVLFGLSSLDHGARKLAYTLLDAHERVVWIDQLAAHGETLLRVRHRRIGAVMGGALFLLLLPVALLLLLLSWMSSSVGLATAASDLVAFALDVQKGFRLADPARVERLLERVGDDPRLVPLLLSHLPPSRHDDSRRLRDAWIERLTRLLPHWYPDDNPLPPAALRVVRRELRTFAGAERPDERDTAFLLALLVSLDPAALAHLAPGDSLRKDLNVLAGRSAGSRVAEGARQAIQQLGKEG